MTITKLHQLKHFFGTDLHRVERAWNSIARDLCSRDETFRLLVYSEFIGQACETLLLDGGPAVALHFLKFAREGMRSEAADRARNGVGPFLSADQLEKLAADPQGFSAARDEM